jgi:hypothetical protein
MILLLLVLLSIATLFGTVGFVAANFDRIAVILLRRLGIPLYPTAIGIALLIVNHPEQWSFDRHRMTHPDLGSIWIANDAYGLKVETAMGDWKPNLIERRIIREAVDWRIGRYLRDRLNVAVQKNALR